jgi:hypothetical protein
MAKARRARMRVKSARKNATKTTKILVTKAQAMSMGEDFSDAGCPFRLSATQKSAIKARKAGRKK